MIASLHRVPARDCHSRESGNPSPGIRAILEFLDSSLPGKLVTPCEPRAFAAAVANLNQIPLKQVADAGYLMKRMISGYG